MIVVTRLDRTRFAVNPDLIERAHASPDTTLHMVDGHVFVVQETLDELVDLIVAYRARVLAAASIATAEG
jgi:flagellar protein FlbD